MKYDVLEMFERMAMTGTAPRNGCSLFGVGYDDAFRRLKNTYIINGFERGSSAEKFVVGPFGSGKTHFLRQLIEIAEELNCVTAEVQLNKAVDFTQSLIVYKEFAREIRTPDNEPGIRSLIDGCIQNVKAKCEDPSLEDIVLNAWISGIDKTDFKLDSFKRMVKRALLAFQEGNEELLESICQWLSGEVDNKALCKELDIQPVPKSEQNLFARRATLSLYQLVRHAGFRGTVVCYDEAEQGLTVDKKKTEKILSMLMAEISATADLYKGSALIIYALTPDLVEKMETFAALQQRISNADGLSFFEGNTYASLIKLTNQEDPLLELQTIGSKLVDVFYDELGANLRVSKEEILNHINNKAKEIVESNISVSNRREMVKTTCTTLMLMYHDQFSEIAASAYQFPAAEEDEV